MKKLFLISLVLSALYSCNTKTEFEVEMDKAHQLMDTVSILKKQVELVTDSAARLVYEASLLSLEKDSLMKECDKFIAQKNPVKANHMLTLMAQKMVLMDKKKALAKQQLERANNLSAVSAQKLEESKAHVAKAKSL